MIRPDAPSLALTPGLAVLAAVLTLAATACDPATGAPADSTSGDLPGDTTSAAASCQGKGACDVPGAVECDASGGQTRACSVDPLQGCLRWTPWTACGPSADKCLAVSCAPGIGCRQTAVSCEDGNVCTLDTCTPAKGCTHAAAGPALCDDGNPCTTDACSPAGCTHVNNTAGCDDGSACTKKDQCVKGHCVGGTPIVCAAADVCHEAGTCDAVTGKCTSPARPDGATCSDLNACTTSDGCVLGKCKGIPVLCSSIGQCQTGGACNPDTGLCATSAVKDGSGCSDGNACTQGDACVAGACQSGSPVVCTALDVCHEVGACDPGTGACTNPPVPDGISCDDDSVCTSADRCVAGVCGPGACQLGWDCAPGPDCGCALGYEGGACDVCAPGFAPYDQIVGWGSNPIFHHPPLVAGRVVAIRANGVAGLALTDHGDVTAWGSSPIVPVPPAAQSGISAIDAGQNFALALTNGGAVIGWGSNTFGAAQVPASAQSGIVAIAAGNAHAVALTSTGQIIAWGTNYSGELTAPAAAQGHFVAIGAGGRYTAGLTDTGQLLAWGSNSYGQTNVPASLASGVTRFDSGPLHTIASTFGGLLTAFGYASSGQLAIPPALQGHAAAFAAGSNHSLALDDAGRVIDWGTYVYGMDEPLDLAIQGRVHAIGASDEDSFAAVTTCQDLDECEDGTASCDPNATCVNLPGTYTCLCNPGYAGNGASCAVDCATAAGGTACDDGLRCTTGDACSGGICVGIPVDCGNDPCQPSGTCSPSTGLCTYTLGTTVGPCDDGATCTVGDHCDGGACVPGGCVDGAICDAGSGSGAPACGCEPGYAAGGVVAFWGGTPSAQQAPPVGLSGVVDIVVGGPQVLALLSDGTVVQWGTGSGVTAVPSGLTEVVSVAASTNGRCYAVKSDGTLVTWGSPTAFAMPPAGLTGLVRVFAGQLAGMALRGDGTVVTWGDPPFAIPVPAGLSGVVDGGVGTNYAVALESDGTVVVWGSNAQGQGNVPAGLHDVIAVAAGAYHVVALKSDGTVVNWGLNNAGQLNVPPGLSGVVGVRADAYSTTAFRADGSLVTWGLPPLGSPSGPISGLAGITIHNDVGFAWAQCADIDECQLDLCGDNAACTNTPGGYSCDCLPGFTGDGQLCDDVDECATGAAVCAAGQICSNTVGSYDCTCGPGLTARPQVIAFGADQYGQSTPPPGLDRIVAISSKNWHTLAQHHDGTLVGWGRNNEGQASIPASVGPVTAFSAGGYHNVAQRSDGVFVAWGRASEQQLNVGSTATHPFVDSMDAGGYFTLALRLNGTVTAWGNNSFGETSVPATLSTVSTNPVTAVSAGGWHGLAIRANGTLVGWGRNDFGQAAAPVSLTNAVAVAAGGYHSLAIRADGTVVCWGRNTQGQCNVPPGLTNVVDVGAGYEHSVALRADGTVLAWGGDTEGQSSVPTGLDDVMAIASGNFHTVALRAPACLDVDECATGTADCDPNATCTNTFGGYECACNPGYIGDGTTCTTGCDGQPDGTPCSDNSSCTTDDACLAGVCTGAPRVCPAIDPCHAPGVCKPAFTFLGYMCTTPVAKDGRPCDDGDLCTTPDTCKAGVCVPGLPTVCTAPDDCHVPGKCDPGTGVCATGLAPDGTPCADGLECTVGDSCALGACLPGNCPPGQLCGETCGCAPGYAGPGCTACEGGFAPLLRPIAWGAPTFPALAAEPSGIVDVTGHYGSLQLALTGAGGVLVTTSGPNPASVAPASVSSHVVAIASGSSHGLALTDAGQVIVWGTSAYGIAAVPPAAAAGVTSIAASVGASYAVTATGDVLSWGVLHPAENAALNVGTAVEVVAGSTYGAVLRSDGRVNQIGFGSASATWPSVTAIAAGTNHLLGLTATGGVVCSGLNGYGQCNVPPDALSGVVMIEAGASHSLALKADGRILAWGLNTSGQLTVPASALGAVHLAATGGASYAFMALCEDIDECATGAAGCAPEASCLNTAGGFDCDCPPGTVGDGVMCEVSCALAGDGATCDDGDPCTHDDVCQSGTCAGVALVCTTDKPCTVAGTCDPSTGKCSEPVPATDGSACDDGNLCTTGDICKAGGCRSAPVTCADLGPCWKAVGCDPTIGKCTYVPLPNGTACDDGNGCTQKDTCQDGACIGPEPVSCKPKDACHLVGVCNPKTGQCTEPVAPNATPCDDGNLCTELDGCKTGICVGRALVCHAMDLCHTTGTCDPGTGACSNPTALDGTPCDDAEPCTNGELCTLGECSGGVPIPGCAP